MASEVKDGKIVLDLYVKNAVGLQTVTSTLKYDSSVMRIKEDDVKPGPAFNIYKDELHWWNLFLANVNIPGLVIIGGAFEDCIYDNASAVEKGLKTPVDTENFLAASMTFTLKEDAKGTASFELVDESTITINSKKFAVAGVKSNTVSLSPQHEHVMTKTAAKEATCTAEGNNEYWTCTACKKVFKDAEGKTETTVEAETTGVLSHKLTKTAAKEATCTAKGNNEYWTCTACKKVFKDADGKTETTVEAETREMLKHSFTKYVSDNNATETADGTKTAFCDVCKTAKDTVAETGTKLSKSVKDASTGITVSYSNASYGAAITLKIENVDPSKPQNKEAEKDKEPTAEQKAVKECDDNYEKITVFDIKTITNGKETQPSSIVKVSIPLPQGYNAATTAVYHIKADGTSVRASIEIKDGKIIVTTDGFSKYVVVDESTKIEPSSYTVGDIDKNGQITVDDARCALRIAVKLDELTKLKKKTGDVDGNGEVSVDDARLILRVAVKLDTADKFKAAK